MSFRIQFNCYCALLGHDTQIPNNRKVASCSRYKDVVADKITGNRKPPPEEVAFYFKGRFDTCSFCPCFCPFALMHVWLVLAVNLIIVKAGSFTPSFTTFLSLIFCARKTSPPFFKLSVMQFIHHTCFIFRTFKINYVFCKSVRLNFSGNIWNDCQVSVYAVESLNIGIFSSGRVMSSIV